MRILPAAANSGFRRRSALHFAHLVFLPKLHPALAFFGMITALDAIRVFSLALVKLICQSRQTRHVKSVKYNCFYFDVMYVVNTSECESAGKYELQCRGGYDLRDLALNKLE